MNYPTITLAKLEEMLDNHIEIQLIDLRNKASYQKCHIDGAINIPFPELEFQLGLLDKSKQIVLYCSRGGQSLLACNYLHPLGYSVVNVASGINSYRGKHLVRF